MDNPKFERLGFLVIGLLLALSLRQFYHEHRQAIFDREDAQIRQTAPDYNLSFTDLRGYSKNQETVIKDLRESGFKLQCRYKLSRKEKIGGDEDAYCWFIIKSIFGFPARHVAIFFKTHNLVEIRVEYPAESYQSIFRHLRRTLPETIFTPLTRRGKPLLDRDKQPIVAWWFDDGVLFCNSEYELTKPNILFWVSRDYFEEKLGKKLTDTEWLAKNKEGIFVRKFFFF